MIKGETKGTGTLSTSSNGEAAGIGGGWFIGCGNINIEGGVITASGGQGAAGIGGGYHASCGNITITTGVTQVTAKYSCSGLDDGRLQQRRNRAEE